MDRTKEFMAHLNQEQATERASIELIARRITDLTQIVMHQLESRDDFSELLETIRCHGSMQGNQVYWDGVKQGAKLMMQLNCKDANALSD